MTWDHDELWGRHPAVTKGDDRTTGQKAADVMKHMLATWFALATVLVGIVVWMTLNSFVSGSGKKFDPFPWILLNLFLSCFAALQCFVLLIANKRGEQIASEVAQHTYENTQSEKQLLMENTELTRQVKANTDRLDRIHAHVESIATKLGIDDPTIG